MEQLKINNSLQYVIKKREIKETKEIGETPLNRLMGNQNKADLILNELLKYSISFDNYKHVLKNIESITVNIGHEYKNQNFFIEGFEICSEESGIIGDIDSLQDLKIEYTTGETFEIHFNGVIDNDDTKVIIQRETWDSYWCK